MYEELANALRTNAVGTILFTNLFFLIFAVLVIYLTFRIAGADSDKKARSANLLVALVGGLCGWVVGTAFSAFSPEEAVLFKSISGTIGIFLSGYVVSKLDRFIEAALFPVDKAEVAWSRVGLFVATLMLAAVTVFLNRLYAFQNPPGAPIAGATDASRPKAGAPTLSPAKQNVPASGAASSAK